MSLIELTISDSCISFRVAVISEKSKEAVRLNTSLSLAAELTRAVDGCVQTKERAVVKTRMVAIQEGTCWTVHASFIPSHIIIHRCIGDAVSRPQ